MSRINVHPLSLIMRDHKSLPNPCAWPLQLVSVTFAATVLHNPTLTLSAMPLPLTLQLVCVAIAATVASWLPFSCPDSSLYTASCLDPPAQSHAPLQSLHNSPSPTHLAPRGHNKRAWGRIPPLDAGASNEIRPDGEPHISRVSVIGTWPGLLR